MIENRTFVVSAEEEGSRFDLVAAARFPESTRAYVCAAIQRGEILLNGARAEKAARLKAGDAVEVVALLEEGEGRAAPDPSLALEVVFDDGYLLGVDKPAGMPLKPSSPFDGGALANGVVAMRPELALVGNDQMGAGALHRLDAGASGLVLFAANNFIFAYMRGLFATSQVKMSFLALVEGEVRDEGRVACELVGESVRSDRLVPAVPAATAAGKRGGKRLHVSETFFRPLRAIGGRTLLEVRAATALDHQVRAQLALAGHPVAGDTLYGAASASDAPSPGGFFLHSLSAAFVHPATGEPVVIRAAPPPWA